MGRAALALAREGIVLVFGDRVRGGAMSGFIAGPGRWRAVEDVAVAAIYDRFAWRWEPARYQAILAELEGPAGRLPVANPPGLMHLCQDKLATQRLAEQLGIPVPAVESDPGRFAARLADWSVAFVKPRFGTAGRGVVRIALENQPGDETGVCRALSLVAELPGCLEALERVRGPEATVDGPLFLQRAVPPPDGFRGVCVRVNMQRVAASSDPGGDSWHANPGVARRSIGDWVVNAARGADVAPADDVLSPATLQAIHGICRQLCMSLAGQPEGEWLVELGFDLVLDCEFAPWLLEINSRPLGRLAALAELDPERFGAAHLEACMRPLRYLARRAARTW